MAGSSKSEEPALDEYFTAAQAVAATLRKIIDNPKAITRREAKAALARFERLDFRAM